MKKLVAAAACLAVVANVFVASPLARAQSTGIRAGYGEADSTWHVGAGAGQYTSKDADSVSWLGGGEGDPHNHSTTQRNSYGVQSRLSYRAIVVEDADGDQVAVVKSDSYLAMDYLARRAGQILARSGSAIAYDEIMHMASHNHSSPYYMSPSWGVWLFQDIFDLRAFEYHARAMADAIMAAEANLAPARMGATKVTHKLFKGMIARKGLADDGSPRGYPDDFGDFGLDVVRFDTLDGEPIAALTVWGQHPEGLDGHDLITGDFVSPLERFVERATGAPLVFGQGDVGSAEVGPGHPELVPDGIPKRWSHAGHAQAERGAWLLAQDVIEGYNQIGQGNALVPFDDDFDVAAGNAWMPGPLSHPYPTVWNCKTRKHVTGDIEGPGLPTCGDIVHEAHEFEGNPILEDLYDRLKAAGIPVPDHFHGPGFLAVEENLRLHLQGFKLGEVILLSCACEAQVDLVLHLESRTDDVVGNLWEGFDWTTRMDCTQPEPEGDWTCRPRPDDPRPSAVLGEHTFSDEAYQRMKAQIHNDARGWDEPANAARANSEPSDPKEIWGNFTHEELPAELGYKLPIGIGTAGEYNGYTVSYREYVAYDHYRKALTSYGPHTADYMSTALMQLAAELNDGDGDDTFDYRAYDEPRHQTDEARQVAMSTALGAASEAAYEAWRAALPDDAGPAAPVVEPNDIARFDAATFQWRGGSNAVDNPTVKVQRLLDGEWVDFADQSGEIQTKLKFPEGINGFFDTYSGRQEWIWTANLEAFNAFPSGIGSTPEGTYRFVVDGLIRSAGRDTPYHLESQPFAVSAWDGLVVNDIAAETDGSVSFTVDSTYPQTYESAFRYVRVSQKNDEVGQPFCVTCSFRPWASAGTIQTATVTVVRADGTTELVEAQLVDGRWVAPTDLYEGDRAFVARGGIVDDYGEINGQRSEEVVGTRVRPPEEIATVLSFIAPTPAQGQYSDDVTFSAELVDADGAPVSGAEVSFALVDTDTVRTYSATTDSTGVATVTVTLLDRPGDYSLIARFAGIEGSYEGSTVQQAFAIAKEDTTLNLSVEGRGNKRHLRAELFDADSPDNTIGGATIEFYADGVFLGEAVTNDNGVATLSPEPRYRGGRHDYEARFAGDDFYRPSSGTASS